MSPTTRLPASATTRRTVLRGIGVTAAAASLPHRGFGQAKAPIRLGFWTFDNPQQRPWVHKRVQLFTEKNPNVKVDFQWFPFADLGKKLSVGFATGTAPEGFVSQDWFMPPWLYKNLLAPLDVQRLGYASMDKFREVSRRPLSAARCRTAMPTAFRYGSMAT